MYSYTSFRITRTIKMVSRNNALAIRRIVRSSIMKNTRRRNDISYNAKIVAIHFFIINARLFFKFT